MRILITFIAIFLFGKVAVAADFTREYGAQTTINFQLYATDGADLKADATCEIDDIKIMKDNGTETTATNCYTDEGQGYSLVLTASEMEAARIVIYIVDQSTKAWLDHVITIETFGNASAQYPDEGVTCDNLSNVGSCF